MNVVQRIVARVDAFQQRRRWTAFPYAVVKKFGDDQAGYLAALVAYYGFFSLFPLLLVFVSVLGLLLRGNPSLQQSILDSALRSFPVIGTDISKNIHSISGSGAALAVGIVGTLWAGLGVTQAAQNAMNVVWDVPRKDRPNFLFSRLRGLLLLAVLGTVVVASTFAGGFAASGGTNSVLDVLLRVAGLLVSLLLNVVLFAVSYRVLTSRDLSWRDVLPGAIVAAMLWTVLQTVGGYYVTHQLKGATNVYGTFAIVIGLLVWIYLGAQVTLLCAEINVVRVEHLWPRSLQEPPLSDADERTMEQAAQAEERVDQERVEVEFDPSARTRERPPPPGDRQQAS
ncbi:MAG TPA: YihY/virulence factor BrkB family protein [Actinomycetota bacterium]